jgi:pimeloyl-ACP methyl ester carboxylesterase
MRWSSYTTRPDLTRDAGHAVYTPTLTGLGERAHLLSPEIGLSTHVQDVVGVLRYEDLNDVILVAHSYGGIVVMGAMEDIADRVRSLVFLDAQMPLTGESVFDIIGESRADMLVELAIRGGEGWRIPPGDAASYGVSDPADLHWVNSKLSAQPLATYREPVGPTDLAWAHPGSFIECQPSAMEPHMLARPRESLKPPTRRWSPHRPLSPRCCSNQSK